jgi:hypothetical protein
VLLAACTREPPPPPPPADHPYHVYLAVAEPLDAELSFVLLGKEVHRAALRRSFDFRMAVPDKAYLMQPDVFRVLLDTACGTADLWPVMPKAGEHGAFNEQAERVGVATLRLRVPATVGRVLLYFDNQRGHAAELRLGESRIPLPPASSQLALPRPPCAIGAAVKLDGEPIGAVPDGSAEDGRSHLFVAPVQGRCYRLREVVYSNQPTGSKPVVERLGGARLYAVRPIDDLLREAPGTIQVRRDPYGSSFGYGGHRRELRQQPCPRRRAAKR